MDVESWGCAGGANRLEMRLKVPGQLWCPGDSATIEIGQPDEVRVSERRRPQLPDSRRLIGSGDSIAAMAEGVISADRIDEDRAVGRSGDEPVGGDRDDAVSVSTQAPGGMASCAVRGL